MRHATPAALDQLEALLLELRKLGPLREKKRGAFYRDSSAFLHFHEDPAGMFADAKLDGVKFTRRRVSTQAEQRALVAAVRRTLNAPAARSGSRARGPGTCG